MKHPVEYKVVALRDCPVKSRDCETPEAAVRYWRSHVTSHPCYNPDVECLIGLALNTRRKITGHYLIATGVLDFVLAHAREVFRPAIVAAAHSVIVMHNHPSGDPTPSQADIRMTRKLFEAGRIIGVHLMDHVVIGRRSFKSLRGLGYLYETTSTEADTDYNDED